jgi:uncharacterized membrane protein YphA (DoxX/SURF4 family)
MIQSLYVFSDSGLLILRAVLGLVLLVHGWPKIKNLRGTVGSFEMMGFRPGIFWGALVVFAEVVGGLAIIFGFFTQIVAFIVAIEFIVIILKVNLKKGLVNGFEFDLLILAATLVLVTSGGGLYSLDDILGITVY